MFLSACDDSDSVNIVSIAFMEGLALSTTDGEVWLSIQMAGGSS